MTAVHHRPFGIIVLFFLTERTLVIRAAISNRPRSGRRPRWRRYQWTRNGQRRPISSAGAHAPRANSGCVLQLRERAEGLAQLVGLDASGDLREPVDHAV